MGKLDRHTALLEIAVQEGDRGASHLEGEGGGLRLPHTQVGPCRNAEEITCAGGGSAFQDIQAVLGNGPPFPRVRSQGRPKG